MKKCISLLLLFIFLFSGLMAQEAGITDLINQGIKLHDKGDYTGAIDLYKQALALDKRSAHANYEIAASYFETRDYANTIKYCNNVIAANVDYVEQAYVLKGSAQDRSGNGREALITYKHALKKYPDSYLLYYNLALTSFNLKVYKDAEDALQRALKINPLHASSHLLLGKTMLLQEKRAKGILALFNFLLLEPKGSRSAAALKMLEDELKGVKKNNNKAVTVTGPGKKDDDEFYTGDLMLDLLESSKKNEANKHKTAQVLFTENTNSFFTILGEMKKDKKSFWWNFYVDYFYTLATNNHTEALCYYITQSKDDAYTEWMQNNLEKMEAFSAWYTKYLHKL